ncbi:SGNH/GDSL hydrolase family protein [Pseudofrankia inefficax]|uniref:Lipolytic protein G-D-S-L family n=1 Tax=Pseudofrankia inefficax (strain DSM 45817 / CECT 9037 / DDB 130130 / EuI1c) TaxID=298654 RepID=E3J4T5_PSEI1|nr:SGNH/GDSL hydrolase family protein [Pseudofrankia inefficax]ADP78254.1 lipolytic protein G-D-S-L family [Pseudofrankia inefficax]
MQLRAPASARARRLVALGVVSLFVTIATLLTACQPPTVANAATGSSTRKPLTRDQPLTIVALGDSYSSGEGNAPFDTDAATCHRSASAWPRLLGQQLTGSTVKLLACSGAKTYSLTSAFHGQSAQITALKSLLSAGVHPDVVTITIGGNDAGFGPTIASCVVWRCFWTGHDNNSVQFVENQLPGLLQTAYQGVKAAAPNARILVVGYPDIFPSRSDNTCKWMDSTERVQLVGLNDDLDRVAKRAAGKAGVEFVSTANTLNGHRLCTTDSWLYPVELLGAGTTASAHPNAQGEQAIADAVYGYLFKGK